jgi:hypothetical protein
MGLVFWVTTVGDSLLPNLSPVSWHLPCCCDSETPDAREKTHVARRPRGACPSWTWLGQKRADAVPNRAWAFGLPNFFGSGNSKFW